MAWLAVDEDYQEHAFPKKPTWEGYWVFVEIIESDGGWYHDEVDLSVELPKGSIEKLIGKKLTWEDEPVEI